MSVIVLSWQHVIWKTTKISASLAGSSIPSPSSFDSKSNGYSWILKIVMYTLAIFAVFFSHSCISFHMHFCAIYKTSRESRSAALPESSVGQLILPILRTCVKCYSGLSPPYRTVRYLGNQQSLVSDRTSLCSDPGYLIFHNTSERTFLTSNTWSIWSDKASSGSSPESLLP